MPRDGISEGAKTAEFCVVGTTIQGINHHPAAIGDLVDHTDAGDLANERRLACTTLENGKVGGATLGACLPQGALHHFERVGALTKGAQFGLELRIKTPDARLQLARKAKPLQGLQTSCLQALLLRIGCMRGRDGENAIHRPSDDLAVKTRQALLLDFLGQFPAGARSRFQDQARE